MKKNTQIGVIRRKKPIWKNLTSFLLLGLMTLFVFRFFVTLWLYIGSWHTVRLLLLFLLRLLHDFRDHHLLTNRQLQRLLCWVLWLARPLANCVRGNMRLLILGFFGSLAPSQTVWEEISGYYFYLSLSFIKFHFLEQFIIELVLMVYNYY